MTTETTLAVATQTVRLPKDYTLKIEAKAYQLGGNAHPHFSVTGEIRRPYGTIESCGCLHEDALEHWPEIEPIVRLHLSNADDGEPMHAEANGWYWLAGAMSDHMGERYHGGNSPRNFPDGYRNPNADDCLETLADHLRITVQTATALRDKLAKMGYYEAKAVFAEFINNERQRWADEAKAGIQLIRRLAAAGTKKRIAQ